MIDRSEVEGQGFLPLVPFSDQPNEPIKDLERALERHSITALGRLKEV